VDACVAGADVSARRAATLASLAVVFATVHLNTPHAANQIVIDALAVGYPQVRHVDRLGARLDL
jgi:hypothetical protein